MYVITIRFDPCVYVEAGLTKFEERFIGRGSILRCPPGRLLIATGRVHDRTGPPRPADRRACCSLRDASRARPWPERCDHPAPGARRQRTGGTPAARRLGAAV